MQDVRTVAETPNATVNTVATYAPHASTAYSVASRQSVLRLGQLGICR